MIKLKVTKFEQNAEYDAQLQAYEKAMEDSRRWGMGGGNMIQPGRPEPLTASSILEVEITEEQWERLRTEVIKTFP